MPRKHEIVMDQNDAMSGRSEEQRARNAEMTRFFGCGHINYHSLLGAQGFKCFLESKMQNLTWCVRTPPGSALLGEWFVLASQRVDSFSAWPQLPCAQIRWQKNRTELPSTRAGLGPGSTL